MADIKPYTISISQDAIDRLQQKLALSELPDELDEAGWEYGTPLADIKRLVKHWRESYDWKKHEAELNKLPHYQTKVPVPDFGDLSIHFVHQPSRRKNAIPLLFCHGWPGSFHEVTKILEPLSNPSDPSSPAFHVVAPSLPNFGFSQGISLKGFGLPQYATTCHNLMLKLGYTQYTTQGGDWGFWITRTISRLFPTHCLATHLNMIPARAPTLLSARSPLSYLHYALTPYTPSERSGLAHTSSFHTSGFGYNALQRTRPQTISYSLADSPVGLLAWIYEKLHFWTDGPYPFTPDEILTWVCIYAFSTPGPAASVRIYKEVHDRAGDDSVELALRWIPKVKIGLAYFPRDIVKVPSSWGRTLGSVVWEERYAEGGHFASVERPGDLVEGLRRMMGRGGGAEGVVRGRRGFD